MKVLITAIDEAGYGPMLGPLCIGTVNLLTSCDHPNHATRDWWHALDSAVCKETRDKAKRIPVNDSKKLKLPNRSSTGKPPKRHPLTHLERGVIAFTNPDLPIPTTDADLLSQLAVKRERLDWYAGDPLPMPLAATTDSLSIDRNQLRRALAKSNVHSITQSCTLVGERRFNKAVQQWGTKAAATALGIGDTLRHTLQHHAQNADAWIILCDRLGGRTSYESLLESIFEDATATQSDIQSAGEHAYTLDGLPIPTTVRFQVAADAAHLPVALASMNAKLVRELMMLRFNRYWCERKPTTRPTAGYVTDARRWLDDMHDVITDTEREALIRAC